MKFRLLCYYCAHIIVTEINIQQYHTYKSEFFNTHVLFFLYLLIIIILFFRNDELTPEERDARTVFCMQLSQRIRARDLEEFFSSVGKVQDVRLITCNKTRRFKGIAYVEFKDPESVTLVSIHLCYIITQLDNIALGSFCRS